MTLRNILSYLIALLVLYGMSFSPRLYAITKATAPTATPAEAPIRYWRMPEVGLRFMDLPELPVAYVSTTPEQRSDGLAVGKLSSINGATQRMLQLAKEVEQGEHGNIDSLLVAHQGKLLFESYYRRGRIDLPHPQSSATKVYISLALGRAIQLGYLTMADLDKPLISFLDELNTETLVDGADKVTLNHALSMRSGIRIKDAQWEASTRSPESLKGQGLVQAYLEMSAPITDESQTFKYQNDPMLVMQVIEAVVPGGARAFIRDELLYKLGITNYGWRMDNVSGLPESSSMTSRAMLKLGLLAKNKGHWHGEQLVPAAFIAKATSRLFTTGDDDIYGGGKDVSNQGYGYYWWSTDLLYAGQRYYAYSAQGGGGMYVLIIDDLDLMVIVTAHDRDDKTQQMVAENILPLFANERVSNAPVLSGRYLGQKTPGITALPFAPGIVSTPGWEYGVVFAPTMTEMYFVREVHKNAEPEQELVAYEYRDHRWQERVIGPRNGTPTLSPDNQTMFFGRGYKTRTHHGWSDMQRLGPDFEAIRIMRVTASNEGNIAFDEATADGNGVLRYAQRKGDGYAAPVPFPEAINTGQWNAHPFLAPDESYVIWDGQRNSANGNADLFISFKNADGSWGSAIKLGREVNTAASEFAAQVTPDGRFLFFNRTDGQDNTDTYWVDAKILDAYRIHH
ncbi:MAG: serine hydrolase [Alteromonadaceae bacterium]|nr:serine hydrolase [Alteromonadaceae bacterium]